MDHPSLFAPLIVQATDSQQLIDSNCSLPWIFCKTVSHPLKRQSRHPWLSVKFALQYLQHTLIQIFSQKLICRSYHTNTQSFSFYPQHFLNTFWSLKHPEKDEPLREFFKHLWVCLVRWTNSKPLCHFHFPRGCKRIHDLFHQAYVSLSSWVILHFDAKSVESFVYLQFCPWITHWIWQCWLLSGCLSTQFSTWEEAVYT
jgi:hypothetical protein